MPWAVVWGRGRVFHQNRGELRLKAVSASFKNTWLFAAEEEQSPECWPDSTVWLCRNQPHGGLGVTARAPCPPAPLGLWAAFLVPARVCIPWRVARGRGCCCPSWGPSLCWPGGWWELHSHRDWCSVSLLWSHRQCLANRFPVKPTGKPVSPLEFNTLDWS